jgi:predicted aspartyl protease
MPETRCGFDDGPSVRGADLLVSLGPTLLVSVGFDPTYDETDLSRAPTPGIERVRALVDTGAHECSIDSALAASLHLPIVDRQRVSGVGGVMEVNVHLAQIHVPALGFTMYGLFSGVHLAAGGQPCAVLIGRTFLRNFVMTYEGNTGTVTLALALALRSPV